MDIRTREILRSAAFVANCDDGGVARARGALFENERYVLALEEISPHACAAARFKLLSQIHEIEHFLIGERRKTHKRAVAESIFPSQHFRILVC